MKNALIISVGGERVLGEGYGQLVEE